MEQSRKEQLLEMLQEDPRDAFLHYALGLEYRKAGHIQEALSYFTRCLELETGYFAAHYQLAELFAEIDILDVAITHARNGLEKARLQKDMKSAGEFQHLLDDWED